MTTEKEAAILRKLGYNVTVKSLEEEKQRNADLCAKDLAALDAEMIATYGPDWEQDADDLHEALTYGNEQIELEETLKWVGEFRSGAKPQHITPNWMTEAEAEHAEWLDAKRTEQEAGY